MTVYFTADLHLHHKNIIRYAHRGPAFRTNHQMDRGLIRNLNRAVRRHDTLYHLGDFCFAGRSNIGEARRAFGRDMGMVHCRTVFLRGNHDTGLRHASYFICRRIDGVKVFMRHWPPWEHPRRFPHSFTIPPDVDLILCGHVHDKWKYHAHKVGKRLIPVVNVGTDVWGYKPVSLSKIVQEVGRLRSP